MNVKLNRTGPGVLPPWSVSWMMDAAGMPGVPTPQEITNRKPPFWICDVQPFGRVPGMTPTPVKIVPAAGETISILSVAGGSVGVTGACVL